MARTITSSVKDLKRSTVDVQPLAIDWSAQFNQDDGPQYRFWEGATCTQGHRVALNDDTEMVCPVCADRDDDTENMVYANGPMYNRFYAIPTYEGSPPDDAVLLAHLSVCLIQREGEDVHRDEEWGLALTGAGQNMTWDIAEAYVLLGYLPPAFACELPGGADVRYTKRRQRVMAACVQTARALEDQAKNIKRNVANLRERIRPAKA